MTTLPPTQVAHEYLFMCLAAAQLPDGIINFFKALYTNNHVFANIDGEFIWLFEALSGVLQGCPASGTLFVIGINPCPKKSRPPSVPQTFAELLPTTSPR